MTDSFNIVFMGTAEFSVPALEALCKSRFNVSLVVTQPDRPKGRGRNTSPPPARLAADRMGCETAQPESVTTKNFFDRIAALKPDFLVVVAFGQLLPEALLSLPRFDAINIHPSILPKYRGPAPIQWAIINREKKTGVTIMSLDAGTDTGDILMLEETTISHDDTAAVLHDRLAKKGADLLIKTLDNFGSGTVARIPQDHSKATFAPLLKKRDGLIDWDQSSENIEAFVRGMTPWPGAFTFLTKKRLKIFKAAPAAISQSGVPGTIIKGFQNELRVATANGALSILEIQEESGKRLLIGDFMRGTTILPGAMLG